MATMDWSAQGGDAPSHYDGFLVPAMFSPLADLLVQRADVMADSSVLDVACGTGVVTRAAARRAGPGGTVTGVDLGEPMLAIARAQPAEENAAPIAYRQSDADSLPFDADSYDVVLCQQGLQFFPDRGRALAEIRRVLKPGGRVAVATWTDIAGSPFAVVADALGRHIGTAAEEMIRSPFGLSDGQELGRLLSEAGFDQVAVSVETIECTFASCRDFARRAIAAGPIAPVFAAADAAAQQAVADEVAERLRVHATGDDLLPMPMRSNVALASA
jgi:ubiquinone/menaquinone biosynthesis C-methylase UbiE